MSTTGSIKDYRVKLVPSKDLIKFLSEHIEAATEVPHNVSKALKRCGFEVPAKVEILSDEEISKTKHSHLDIKLLRKVLEDDNNKKEEESNSSQNEALDLSEQPAKKSDNETYFYLSDLRWLNKFFGLLRDQKGLKCYLHQFITSSKLILPENEIIERNPVLEARCQKLREDQQNREYRKMTKNVDAVLKNHPEDTIAYQMKSINSQIIAVLQFVFSVVAGFVFGFLGVELIVGNLEFGFRLLLGIMCALIIALAEIYFLAKKLNEIDDATAASKLPMPPNRTPKAHKD